MRIRSLIGFTILIVTVAWPQNRSDVEAALNRGFQGKVLTQRRFFVGGTLSYTGDGEVPAGTVGSWTTWGQVRVLSVAVPDPHTIWIRGERVFLWYDTGQRDFRETYSKENLDSPSVVALLGERGANELRKLKDVVINIDLPGPMDEAAARAAIANVFLGPTEHLSDFVPQPWRDFLVHREVEAHLRPDSDLVAAPVAEKVGDGVTSPKAIFSPDPSYDTIASFGHYQGLVRLAIVIDKEGKTRDIRIVKPAGVGLDDKAAEAVSTWRFHPAARDGSPVAVEVQVEVNFRLY